MQFLFKPKERRRYLFTNRYRQRFSLWWICVWIVIGIIGLELFSRIFLYSFNPSQDSLYDEQYRAMLDAYQLKVVNQQGNSDPTNLSEPGQLKIQPSVSVGYELLKNQESTYWKINDRGFRDKDSLPLTKPKNEIRVFLLGSSTAFGYGSSNNNTTISEHLEKRLQTRIKQQIDSPQLYRPDILPIDKIERENALKLPPKIKQGNYRVINASVPGYASGNQLAQFALNILKYKPDLIIILSGYDDLILSSEKEAVEIPQLDDYFDSTGKYLRASLSQLIQPLENHSYFLKLLQESIIRPQVFRQRANFINYQNNRSLASQLPQNKKELQTRIDRYFRNNQQIVKLAAANTIPVIIATQPEITGRNLRKLDRTESKIITQLGRKYINKSKKDYPRLVRANKHLQNLFPHNVKSLNLYNLKNNYPTPTFIDRIHLTESANKAMAEEFYHTISNLPKMQIPPQLINN